MLSTCPIPLSDYPAVTLAHGGGGALMNALIAKMFRTAFRNPLLDQQHDGAIFDLAGRAAFSPASLVVRPLFCPGGAIGTPAVCGTVNDLAMCGARPLYLSAGFIIEEGLPMADLWRVVQSMQRCAADAGVQIVTGDTKVVDRGKGDGLYINTSGVGVIEHDLTLGPAAIRPGDAVLVNGDLGRHGIAIMAAREGLAFETTIESDSAALNGLVGALLAAGLELHCLRDLTRGGLASALNELAGSARLAIRVDERRIPVREDVQGACELLGFDPLYVANEGRLAVILPAAQAERALAVMRADPQGRGAAVIGEVLAPIAVTSSTAAPAASGPAAAPAGSAAGVVTLTTRIGVARILDLLSGEQLPRIC